MLIFSCPREEFTNAVLRASQGLAGNPPQPVYAGMLFSGENDEITITASDGDMTFSAKTGAEVHSAGRALLPGKMISEISRYFAGKTVTLDYQEKGICEITAGRSRFTLSAVTGGKYPKWSHLPPLLGALDAEEFAMAVRRVIPAASKIDPVMRGVFLAPIEGKLYVVATDRARMAVMAPEWTRHENESGDDVSPCLASTAVLERFARAAADEDMVRLGWNDAGIGFGTPGLQVTSRLISGTFPGNWKQVLDSAPGSWVTFSPEELTRIVKMAALAADEGRIDLTFDGNDLHVAASQQGRSFSDYTDTDYAGDTITIALGAQVLLDGLSACKGQARIAFTAPLKPVFLRSGDYSYMCQPRRDV